MRGMYLKHGSLAKSHEMGYSLIELMVAIAIGLVITAAATQMLLTSLTSVTSQHAGSDIQSDGIFGIETLAKSIRMANYGALDTKEQPAQILNNKTLGGGIVLTIKTDTSSTPTNIMAKMSAATAAKIKSGESSQATNLVKSGGGAVKADTLTTQRFTQSATFDCQGNAVPANHYIVETYYLALDSIRQSNEPNALALQCMSNHYKKVWVKSGSVVAANTPGATQEYHYTSTTPFISTTSNKPAVIINRVDYFKVLLGVDENTLAEAKRVYKKTGESDTKANKKAYQYVPSSTQPSNARLRYMTVATYNGLTQKPQIASVKLGFVVRSSSPTNAGPTNAEQRFDVLEKTGLKLNSTVQSKADYQRQVYEETIYIRNARG